jgi:hypothetical protein
MIFIRFGVSHKLTSTIPAQAGIQRPQDALRHLKTLRQKQQRDAL